ncbi:hypothetical protein PS6_003665 [Mucor atramentarius]
MQLRSRTSRHTNVKARGQPRQLLGNNNGALGIRIKQEVADKNSSTCGPDSFLNRDYYYVCNECNSEMPSLKATLGHRKAEHPHLAVYKEPTRFIHHEPDIHHRHVTIGIQDQKMTGCISGVVTIWF